MSVVQWPRRMSVILTRAAMKSGRLVTASQNQPCARIVARIGLESRSRGLRPERFTLKTPAVGVKMPLVAVAAIEL